MKLALCHLWIAVALAQAAELCVYSEFQRPDPFGNIVAADRARKPREILSPAVMRNAWTSFHVTVTAPAKSLYFLAVQSNPKDVFQWKLYEEKFAKHGEDWIPDELVEMRAPYVDVMDTTIPQGTTKAYLLDVWVPRETPVGTMRLEVLVKTGHWIVWPMEVRVQEAIAPDAVNTGDEAALPHVSQPADSAASGVVEAYLQDEPIVLRQAFSIRGVIRRNALQDLRVAQLKGKANVEGVVRKAVTDRSLGAEWYLRVRDFLLR